jgi:hypothetical protein
MKEIRNPVNSRPVEDLVMLGIAEKLSFRKISKFS